MISQNNVSVHQVQEQLVAILNGICEQWGMPWSELKLDGERGAPLGRSIVRLAITAEFLRRVEPMLTRGGFDPDGRLRVADVALLIGVSTHTVQRNLREIRHWQDLRPGQRMTGPERNDDVPMWMEETQC